MWLACLFSVYFNPTALGLVYASVDTDESYAKTGYTTGASISNEKLVISFVRNLGNGLQFIPCTSSSLWINRSNVCIGGIIERPAPEPTSIPIPTPSPTL